MKIRPRRRRRETNMHTSPRMSPDTRSMIICCLTNCVDRQMSTAITQQNTRQRLSTLSQRINSRANIQLIMQCIDGNRLVGSSME